MSSTIIELSRVTSNDKTSYAQWKNSIKSGIILEDGDQVLLKNCYIDTTNLSSNNFIINEDIICRIDFGFYLICSGIEQYYLTPEGGGLNGQSYYKYNKSDPAPEGGLLINPDGMPYILTSRQTNRVGMNDPYIDYVEFTIPAGIYSKTYLAEYISRQLQSINVIVNQPWPGCYSNSTPQDPNTQPPPPYKPIEVVYQNLSSQASDTSLDDVYIPSVGIQPIFVGELTYPIQPNYTCATFSKFLTQLPPNTEYLYNDIFQVCDALGGGTLDSGYIGCPNMSISFNQDTQKYQWDYLHASITDNNQNEQTAIGYFTNNATPPRAYNVYINQRCGLMLTNLQPVSLWQDMMGFDLNKILFTNDFNNVTYEEFFKKTTQNFPAVSSLINVGKNVTINNYTLQSAKTIITTTPTPIKFSQSTATTPIIAKNLSKGTIISAGHYLIDIKGYNTQYKNAFGDTQYKGLVSAFFLSSDSFLSAPSPDSSFYIHHGSPQCLNYFETTIINPLTHKPADNLGENSSVYIQVIKNKKTDTKE